MDILKKGKIPKFLIFLVIAFCLVVIWIYLFLIGFPAKTQFTIPPYQGLINILPSEPKGDIQTVLSYKLSDNGNAADYYQQAFYQINTAIFHSIQFVGPWMGEYNPDYKGIDLIIKGTKFERCSFPKDFYYMVNTTGLLKYSYYWITFLSGATLTRATVLLEKGEYEKARECIEAVIVFGRHTETAKLNFRNTEEGNKVLLWGLGEFMRFGLKTNQTEKLKICNDFDAIEYEFKKQLREIDQNVFSTDQFMSSIHFSPRIKNLPFFVSFNGEPNLFEPLIEGSLYHQDTMIRVECIMKLGSHRNRAVKKVLGLSMRDRTTINRIEHILNHIATHDSDPYIRDMAVIALNKTSRKVLYLRRY